VKEFETKQKLPNYIDSEGVGHIRIIKSINLKALIEIFKDLYLELKKILVKNRISLYMYPVRSMKKCQII
jgi:hypothetical protein